MSTFTVKFEGKCYTCGKTGHKQIKLLESTRWPRQRCSTYERTTWQSTRLQPRPRSRTSARPTYKLVSGRATWFTTRVVGNSNMRPENKSGKEKKRKNRKRKRQCNLLATRQWLHRPHCQKR